MNGTGNHQQTAMVTHLYMIPPLKPNCMSVYIGCYRFMGSLSWVFVCRVCFGDRTIFVVNDPRKVAKFKKEGKKWETISYEFAQKELAGKIVAHIEGGL